MTSERVREILTDVSRRMTGRPIESERVRLRPLCAADAAAFYRILSQPEVCRLSGMPPCKSEADAKDRLEGHLATEERPPLTFAIVLKETDETIGTFTIGIYPFIKADEALADKRGVSLSFMLDERFQRRGLMTELLDRALDYYLLEEGLDFVNCGYFSFNEGSRRLQEKVGMLPYITHVFPFGDQTVETHESILFCDQRRKQREKDLLKR